MICTISFYNDFGLYTLMIQNLRNIKFFLIHFRLLSVIAKFVNYYYIVKKIFNLRIKPYLEIISFFSLQTYFKMGVSMFPFHTSPSPSCYLG